MIFRKRLLVIATLGLLLVPAAMSGTAAPDSFVTVSTETIHITDSQVTLSVVFKSETGDYNGTIEVGAPAGATLVCQGIELDPTWNDGIAAVDLGAHGLVIPADGNLSVTARYSRDGDIVHHMLYSARVNVTVDSDAYVRANIPLSYAGGGYTGTASLAKNEVLTISFASGADDGGTTLLYLGAGLIVGALAVGALLTMLQRHRRDRHLEKEPVEVLEMRKKLLTQLLKQLEIERDKGKVADAYYQSIKDYFKEEAVEVMREIDRRS